MSNMLFSANVDNALIEQVKSMMGITDEKTVIEKVGIFKIIHNWTVSNSEIETLTFIHLAN